MNWFKINITFIYTSSEAGFITKTVFKFYAINLFQHLAIVQRCVAHREIFVEGV